MSNHELELLKTAARNFKKTEDQNKLQGLLVAVGILGGGEYIASISQAYHNATGRGR